MFLCVSDGLVKWGVTFHENGTLNIHWGCIQPSDSDQCTLFGAAHVNNCRSELGNPFQWQISIPAICYFLVFLRKAGAIVDLMFANSNQLIQWNAI